MQKLGTWHDELTASGAGHRFHAAEYISGSVPDDRPGAKDLAKGTHGHDERSRFHRLLVFQGDANERRVIALQQFE